MRYDWLDAYLMSKKGVTKDFKAEWNWIRYQIGGKLFTALCLDSNDNPTSGFPIRRLSATVPLKR